MSTFFYFVQFLKRKDQILSVENLGKTHVGTKDITRSLYAIWEQLFWQKNGPRNSLPIATVRDASEKCKLYFLMFILYLVTA